MIRPAIYSRVSTLDQSTDMQVRELREYCEKRSPKPPHRSEWSGPLPLPKSCNWSKPQEFTDAGVSSRKERRPGLDALMDAVRRRKVDIVVVWKFDRFARSTRELLEALAEFDALGVQFVSLHDQIDTTTPAGRFFFTIVAAFAELERDQIRERVRGGIANARAKGVQLGRPRTVAVDAGFASRVAKLRALGRSWASIWGKEGVSEGSGRRALIAALGKFPATARALSPQIRKKKGKT